MVYGVCRAMLRDVHEAEDATQQAFLSAYKALLGGADVRDPGGWLATIARNECRGRIAAGMKTPLPLADEDLEAIPSPTNEHGRRAQLQELRDALAELPERQREAIVLRYLYGLRYREVATALGISRPATEALLFRARRALQVRLRPVAGAALVVPLAVREELALAIPGFSAGASTSTAAVGAVGGVLAKLTAGPIGVKVATATVAVSTVGAVGAVESDRSPQSDARRASLVAVADRSVDGDSDPGPGSRLDVVGSSSSEGRESGDVIDSSGGGGNGRGEASGDDERRTSGSDGDSRQDTEADDTPGSELDRDDDSTPGSSTGHSKTKTPGSDDSSGPGSGEEEKDDEPVDTGNSGSDAGEVPKSDGSSDSSGPGSGDDDEPTGSNSGPGDDDPDVDD